MVVFAPSLCTTQFGMMIIAIIKNMDIEREEFFTNKQGQKIVIIGSRFFKILSLALSKKEILGRG